MVLHCQLGLNHGSSQIAFWGEKYTFESIVSIWKKVPLCHRNCTPQYIIYANNGYKYINNGSTTLQSGAHTHCAHISSWLGSGGPTFQSVDFRVAFETHLALLTCVLQPVHLWSATFCNATLETATPVLIQMPVKTLLRWLCLFSSRSLIIS